MKQRVVIAMALACNPKLLIADEPTTALDVTIQAQVLDLMKKLKDQYNTSMILITHDLGIVTEICDNVAIMYAGEIVEEGDVFEVFHNPAHPYSQALLSSLPRCRKTEQKLKTIEGTVPRILEKKPECRFRNRCPFASDICAEAAPGIRHISATHTVRCHNRG